MKPDVSIIIPVYNSERYISDCLYSLFEQSLSNVEYIFVDDCSSDNSIDIINTVSKLYPNRQSQIKVIQHKSNKGVASSRQDGLNAANGEYVIHCDSDDWIEQNFLEDLVLTAKQENADVVFCDFQYDSPTISRRVNQSPNNFTSQNILCELFTRLHGSTCNKLIKKSVIERYKIGFDPRFNFCEDLLFNAKLFLHPLSISYSNRALYHYRAINNNSVVRNYSTQSFQLDQQLADTIISVVKDTLAKDNCLYHTSYLISWRAFIGNCFNSKEYKRNVKPYLRNVLYAKVSTLQKIILFLSAIGCYKNIYKLYILIKSLLTKIKSS